MAVALPRHDDIMRQAIELTEVSSSRPSVMHSAPPSAAGRSCQAALDGQRALAWNLGHSRAPPGPYGPAFRSVRRARRGLLRAHGQPGGSAGGHGVRRTDRRIGRHRCALAPVTADGDVSLLDLGEHRLKDPRPARMGVPAERRPGTATRLPSPSLAGHPRLRHNLPARLTSFVGRSRELAEIGRCGVESRLVTLPAPVAPARRASPSNGERRLERLADRRCGSSSWRHPGRGVGRGHGRRRRRSPRGTGPADHRLVRGRPPRPGGPCSCSTTASTS